MLVEGKYLFYGSDISDALEIRKQVFQVEQNIDSNIEFDNLDDEAIHGIVYTGGKAVATGRLTFDDFKYKIGRIAVLKEERGNKYGDFVVRMLIDKAFLSGAKEVFVNAQIQTVGFYEKIGFSVCGDEFQEAGIKHLPMKMSETGLCKGCSKL